jgi:hypothetical protein
MTATSRDRDRDNDTDRIGLPEPAGVPWTRRPILYGVTAAAGILSGTLCGWAVVRQRASPPAAAPAPKRAPAARKAPGPEEAREAEYRRLVEFGTRCSDEASDRLRKSDPETNPAGWSAENDAALDLLTRARDYYNQALEIREDHAVMQRLQDAQFKMTLARKRKNSP